MKNQTMLLNIFLETNSFSLIFMMLLLFTGHQSVQYDQIMSWWSSNLGQ